MMSAPGTSIPFEDEGDAASPAATHHRNGEVPDDRAPDDPPPDIELLSWTVAASAPGELTERRGA